MRNSKEVAAVIKRLREQKKLTVTEFAERVGLNKSTISRYENGSRKIPMEDIPKFARALNVSTQFLLMEESDDTIAAHMDDDLTDDEKLQVQAYIAGLKANRK